MHSSPPGAIIHTKGVRFRVWAPESQSVEVISGTSAPIPLQREERGFFSGVADLRPGDLYRYRLRGGADDGDWPDPASRFQPDGPHGPSQIVDPRRFPWTDTGWQGISIERAVIYELHIGTFTQAGTWQGAIRELAALRDLGITVIEVMPVADFSGKFGWGYDGVNLYAPSRLYGLPDDMRSFVNAAHALGIAVILDVVYNHLGADGNYLAKFSKDYFSRAHTTDWGDAINFDGPCSDPVREYYISNAGYWIEDFHLDGLRVDATQNIYDDSQPHILAEITHRVRDAAGGRHSIVVAENEPQETCLVRDPAKGGHGMDALWNDDFHHSSVVALTGHNDAYYTDYLGTAQEFVSAMKYGYLYQGQWYKWQKKRRGTSSLGLKPSSFITFIENHDQVANSAHGTRIHKQTTPGLFKAMTALLLLGPGTPMLFQGQEFASSKRFLYFADLPADLAALVREGRKEFMQQWRTMKMPEMLQCLADPCSLETFTSCKLDFTERERNQDIYRLHTDLLRLRREDPVFSSWQQGRFDGAVLSERAFLLRAFAEEHGDRLLVINLGTDLHLDPAPEPLLAPLDGMKWEPLLATEHPLYGGCGSAPADTEENWRIPGHSALVFRGIRGEQNR